MSPEYKARNHGEEIDALLAWRDSAERECNKMTKYPQRLSIIPAISAATDYYRSNHTDSGEDGQDYIRAEFELEEFHKAFFEFKAAIHPITHCDLDEALEYFEALDSAWHSLGIQMLIEATAHCPDGKT